MHLVQVGISRQDLPSIHQRTRPHLNSHSDPCPILALLFLLVRAVNSRLCDALRQEDRELSDFVVYKNDEF